MRPALLARPARPVRRALPPLLVALLLAGGAAHAQQYKVIGPDGRVTYTDRAPSSEQGRVVPLGGDATRTSVIASDSPLPLELREPAQRYPVTLYTTPNACDPCTLARGFLRQRGIPYAERQVLGNEDGEALERITGAREAPTLTIGSQTLRGFAAETWTQYLDLAGYPKTSRLPSTWNARVGPVVERQAVAAPAPAAAVAPPPTTAPAAGAGGIRF